MNKKKQQQTSLETEEEFSTGANYTDGGKHVKNKDGAGYLQHSQHA